MALTTSAAIHGKTIIIVNIVIVIQEEMKMHRSFLSSLMMLLSMLLLLMRTIFAGNQRNQCRRLASVTETRAHQSVQQHNSKKR